MLEMRTITPGEFEEWVRAEARAYGNRLNVDPEILRPHFDLDRSIAVFDQGKIVGGAHSHRIDLSIPGSSAVTAGVANVAVQPTHRRQGVMTHMMRHQIKDVHQRGEPLAALFASESAIYGRFGYGVGSFREQWTIERQHTAFLHRYQTNGRFFFVDSQDLTKQLPEICLRSTAGRPGVVQKPFHIWERESHAPEHREGGRGGLFYVAYEENGRVEGYAKYRTSPPNLTVQELMATTPEARAALWRFCFDIDLITTTEAERRPVDDPLPWMLADPRRLQRNPRDGMWLRLVDVVKALTLRRYENRGPLVFEIQDDLCPWNQGRFELEGSAEAASCRATTAAPDLALDIAALGSAYLGGVSFTTLSQAGLVEELTPGALFRAGQMFAVQQQPWAPFGF